MADWEFGWGTAWIWPSIGLGSISVMTGREGGQPLAAGVDGGGGESRRLDAMGRRPRRPDADPCCRCCRSAEDAAMGVLPPSGMGLGLLAGFACVPRLDGVRLRRCHGGCHRAVVGAASRPPADMEDGFSAFGFSIYAKWVPCCTKGIGGSESTRPPRQSARNGSSIRSPPAMLAVGSHGCRPLQK
ncbi:hypothetical protein ACLOJK_016846 [Asimina triloba]